MDFMPSVGALVAVLVAISMATRRHREIRARGNRISWTNTLVTGLASVAITLCAIGALYVGLTTDHLVAGIVVFAVLMLGGQIGAALLIARRWPTEIPDRRQ